jgi:hypothetical protein
MAAVYAAAEAAGNEVKEKAASRREKRNGKKRCTIRIPIIDAEREHHVR